jgi:hypothetical protein
MLDQYRKTFIRMQITIAVVTAAVYLGLGHQWRMAAMFFAVMQISAVIGAHWAVRLRALVLRREALPLQPR